MNYAATYYIGDISSPRRKTAEKTASAVSRVRPLDETAKGRRRSPERQTKVCSPQPTADGFLKTTFLPRLKVQEAVQSGKKSKKMERDFYKSLSRLAWHYGIVPMPLLDFEYPYNIALSLADTQQKLKNKVAHWDNLKLIQDGTKTYLITEERYSTSSTLYYIPMIPLFLMLKDKPKKKSAQLLLSVCAYLYHTADIPYYRQEDTYLYWQYEMMADWIEQDETDETSIYKNELRQAEWIGERMEQKLFSRKNLEVMKDRLNQFKIKTDFDKECFEITQKAVQLYEVYPTEKFFKNASAQNWEDTEDEDQDDDNILTVEKYISFYADNKGWLAGSLFEGINNEFAEYGDIEEPAIKKCFDGSPLTGNSLDFEDRLFTVLDDLIYLLNNYKFQHNE